MNGFTASCHENGKDSWVECELHCCNDCTFSCCFSCEFVLYCLLFYFMRGRTYRFVADGISSSHPFKIRANGTDHPSSAGISGSSGHIEVKINDDFAKTLGAKDLNNLKNF